MDKRDKSDCQKSFCETERENILTPFKKVKTENESRSEFDGESPWGMKVGHYGGGEWVRWEGEVYEIRGKVMIISYR